VRPPTRRWPRGEIVVDMNTTLIPTPLAAGLRARGFVGRLVEPGDFDYDKARAGWNGPIDRHPAAVAYASDADDVAAAIRARSGRRAGFHHSRRRTLGLRAVRTVAGAPSKQKNLYSTGRAPCRSVSSSSIRMSGAMCLYCHSRCRR
jgi:hypothetical protein